MFGCVDAFGAVHVALSLGMMLSAFSATSANVVDGFIRERGFPKPTMSMAEFRAKHHESLVKKQLFWCKHCSWYVTKTAKHCRACNRCTDEFDHHCRWLNNCVSKRNYSQFVLAICCTESLLLYEIALGALMLAGITPLGPPAGSPLIRDALALHSLLVLHLLIAAMMALPLLQLIGFHLYLRRKEISTYEWVVRRDTDRLEKEERAENERVRAEMERKGRASASARAKERTANFDAERANAQQIHRKHIKSEMLATLTSKLCALCSKGNANGDARGVSGKYDATAEIAVDTNVDVKLSGLTSNGSTDDFPANDALELKAHPVHAGVGFPEPQRRWCVCCCAKKRNAVGSLVWVQDRMQKYHNEDGHGDPAHGDVDDVIFGPENVGHRQREQVVEVVEEEPLDAEQDLEEEEEARKSPRLLSAEFVADEEKV